MRQKFTISQDVIKNELKIREYAIIDKELKNVASTVRQNDNFALLCEETYDGEIIVKCISKGQDALVDALRTPNLFPIEPLAFKIAASVTELIGSEEEFSVELFFNDTELLEDLA